MLSRDRAGKKDDLEGMRNITRIYISHSDLINEEIDLVTRVLPGCEINSVV